METKRTILVLDADMPKHADLSDREEVIRQMCGAY